MKILIAADTYHPHINGASYFGQRLAAGLKERGHEIAVLSPAESFNNDSRVDEHGIQRFGVRSISLMFHHAFRFTLPAPFIKSRVREVIVSWQPDLIHSQGHFSIGRSAIAVAKERGIKVVATNHFMPENLTPYLHLPERMNHRIKEIMWRDFVSVFKHAARVTTPTETAAKLIRGRLPQSIDVISCGVDLTRFTPENRSGSIRARYHLPENVRLLLFVGRLDPEKNVDLLMHAAKIATAKADFHVVIAGAGVEERRLSDLVKELGLESKVTLTGFVANEDLPALYASADGFLLACAAELQSIATLEAMASGLPVIVVNALALPELGREGENGFLFKDLDAADCAEKMAALFSDEPRRKAMGVRSREIAETHDIRKTISAFESLYTETLG